MRYLVMTDGFKIQVEPVMNEIQHFASGTGKYYSYERYLKLCPIVMENIKEVQMLEQKTGLRQKPMTEQKWKDFLEYVKEYTNIKYSKIKSEVRKHECKES